LNTKQIKGLGSFLTLLETLNEQTPLPPKYPSISPFWGFKTPA